MKQIKRINMLYMVSVILMVFGSVLVSFLAVSKIKMPLLVNLILSQSFIVLPGLIYILIFGSRYGVALPFNKIKIANVFLMFIYAELCIPLTSCVNIFSQLFTKNAVMDVSDQMMDMPFAVLFLIVGIIAPFCEELVFRGIIFNGFSKTSKRVMASALASGLFFGLMHLNLNQCCYTFVLGIIFALTDEILGSIWPSVIIHCVVNSQNVGMLYVVNMITKRASISLSDAYAEQALNKSMILIMGIVYLAVALFTTSLAIVLLYGMSNIEGREQVFTEIFSFKKKKVMETEVVTVTEETEEAEDNIDTQKKMHIITAAGYAGIIICVIIMFFLEPIMKLIAK